MEPVKLYKWPVMTAVIYASWAAEVAMFAYVWYAYYDAAADGNPLFFRRGNWLVIALYALLLYVCTRLYGGYKIGHLKRGDVIFSSLLSLLFVNGVTYLQISLIARRFLPPGPMVALTALSCIWVWCWGVGAAALYQRFFPPARMLLIYGSDMAESLIDKLSVRADRYNICQSIDVSLGLERVFQAVDAYGAVIICDVKSNVRNEILKYCYSKSVQTYLTPKISDTIVRGADPIHLVDTPLLLCKSGGLNRSQRFVKRAVDIALSLVALVVLSPVMAAVAVAIKLEDGGPVLYDQTRLTRGGETFRIYKFRSMKVNAEGQSGARLASEGDDRITRVGGIIRRLRLDELPQLWNILKGDMAVVGPRPERPELAMEYERSMPEFGFRLKVKAGLTGYAQIMGKYNTTPYDKLKLDLMYIETYTIFLDAKLILMTIKTLFVKSSTEGVRERPTAGEPERPAVGAAREEH